MNKQPLTIPEFARLKNVSRITVYNSIEAGRLNTRKKYGKRLIVMDKKALSWEPKPGKRTDLEGGKK